MRHSVFILLLLVTAQLWLKLVTVVWFEYNQPYIAETLCVNKNNPQSHCEGRCVLHDQLSRIDETTPHEPIPSSVPRLEFLEFSAFLLPILWNGTAYNKEITQTSSAYFNVFYLAESLPILSPPPRRYT